MRSRTMDYKLYAIWCAMRQRINNPANKLYPRYGARGISIAPEWDNFREFERWSLASGYSEGMTIDRKDNDGDYTPDNCQWLTRAEHATKTLTKDAPRRGQRHPMARLCRTDIERIKDIRLCSDLSFKSIGQYFGVSSSSIYQICKGKSWSHVN